METKLNWKSPSFNDLEIIKSTAEINNSFGNEMSAVNLFLYQHKYNTKIAFWDNMLFRQYSSSQNTITINSKPEIVEKIHFGLPLSFDSQKENSLENKTQTLIKGIEILKSQNEENKKSLSFLYVYEEDLSILQNLFPNKIHETINDKNFDYLYLRENLDTLQGSKYQKKRNHISRFLRSFPEAKFQLLNKNNAEDAWKIEKLWFEAAKNQNEKKESLDSIEKEFFIIKEALENLKTLNLSGGVVYIKNEPIAMTVASKINSKVMDIHFEKALMPYAFEGAYSYINNQFAKTQDSFLFNREEDLGLEGLKKAKLSYYPTEILQKWSVKIDF